VVVVVVVVLFVLRYAVGIMYCWLCCINRVTYVLPLEGGVTNPTPRLPKSEGICNPGGVTIGGTIL